MNGSSGRHHLFFQFISEPQDVNFGGKVHGGIVMKWIDQAAYACAGNWSGGYCVTVYVGGIRFYKPILIGAIVRVEARIIYTGKTSMHIAVDVMSKKIGETSFEKTTHCIIVFVAVDENGRPRPVPAWTPRTAGDKAMETYARRLMELRRDIDLEMKPHVGR
ncbi:MAG TPA: acyl-CoA thioesterase [Edaphocola sp.]|nr:acyl-CoA thioesterase [Edaphocola sp.]